MATTNTTPRNEFQRRAHELTKINQKIIDARFLLATELCEHFDDTDYTHELWSVARLLKEGNILLADMIESVINEVTNNKAGI